MLILHLLNCTRSSCWRSFIIAAPLILLLCSCTLFQGPDNRKATSSSQNPLVGYWRQADSDNCARRGRVEELIFQADGKFKVTWTPFESYVDYWGTYTFDPASGRLDLSVEDGNYVPGDVTSGPLVLAGDTFTLAEPMSFGTSPLGQRCAAPFRKYR